MRLLHLEGNELILTNFTGQPLPPYAILSHRWTAEEILFDDVKRGNYKEASAGWRKIKFCAEKAAQDGLKYFWCDTCCIDKWNKAELARSVNSMFKYYRDAAKCYVYLQTTQAVGPDAITSPDFDVEEFRCNEWFKRGWTLQELVAPPVVEFYDSQAQKLGDRTSYRQVIHEITGIPLAALDGDLTGFSQEDRLQWAEGRVTTEPEDGAYCLLGILGVQMPLTYGEGREKAFSRLRRELDVQTPTPCLLPLSRKDHTIGQEAALAEIESKLFGPRSVRAMSIVGASGLGKSHLALEFAYRTRERRPDCSVFWCDASSSDSLNQSYSDIAQKLKIASDTDQPDSVRDSLYRYLCSREAGEWLLVYDNADEISSISAVLGVKPSELLAQGLPGSKTGSILVATTNSELSRQISSHFFKMPELTVEESGVMLHRYLASPPQRDEGSTATDQLGRMLSRPLAVVLAAACIRTRGLTIQEYVTGFEAWATQTRMAALSISDETACTDTKVGDTEQEGTSPAPIPADDEATADQHTKQVIQFSVDQVINTNLEAAACLFEMGCLHRSDMPLSVIFASQGEKTHGVLTTLANYGLITRRPALSAVDMQNLVHIVVRHRLDKMEHRADCLVHMGNKLLDTFPEVDEQSRSQWRRLLPHARQLFDRARTEEESQVLVGLKYRCGKALCYDGRYKEAEELQVQVVETSNALVMDDRTRLVSMGNLAATLERQGRWQEAEKLQRKIFEISERVLGDDHQLDTVAIMNNLSETLRHMGRWKEAEDLQTQALGKAATALGTDHSVTLNIMSNLASAYRDQGRWQEAINTQSQVYEIKKRVDGHDHPDTLNCMSRLALTYNSQGQRAKAEQLLSQVLMAEKEILGPNHPSTLISMNNLASVIHQQGRSQEAEMIQSEALDVSRRVLGRNHPETLCIMNNISLSYMAQRRWGEAEELQAEFLAASETVLGSDNPSTLTARNNLATIYMSQRRWEEAEKILLEILETSKRVLGDDHPEILTILNNLASAIGKQGRLPEAQVSQEQVLEMCESILGQGHPNTQSTMVNLASTYMQQGLWEPAQVLLIPVFKTRKEALGLSHPKTITIRSMLFRLQQMQGR